MPEEPLDSMSMLMASVAGLNRRFPNGNEPFQILSRLLEEAGELAQQVHHFEGQGVKREKYGEPDREKLAKEVMDVMRCALQIAQYYGIEGDLAVSIDRSYRRLNAEGYLSACPACGRWARWTGKVEERDGRRVLGMTCPHCSHVFWEAGNLG